MIFVILRESILVILFTKGPMKVGMFSVVGRESERVFGVLGMFRDDFSVSDMRGCSFVAVDHPCSELVGVLRLFIFKMNNHCSPILATTHPTSLHLVPIDIPPVKNLASKFTHYPSWATNSMYHLIH